MHKNIIWLSIDSLSDIFVTKKTMPFLDSLMASRFRNHVACTPYTSASWYNQITGQYAQDMGYTSFDLSRCNDRFFKGKHHHKLNVIQKFKEAGYYTVLDSIYADWMDWLPGWSESNKIAAHVFPHRPKHEPFLWVYHYPGIHHATTGPNRPQNLYRENYLALLPYHDAILNTWLKVERKHGDIIVVTSDHGITWIPNVDEHHGATLYESSIRTLFGLSGFGPGHDNYYSQTRNIDVGPTLLSLIGEDIPCEGINLFGGDIGGAGLAILETGSSWETPGFHSRFGVRTPEFKYVFDWTSEAVYALRDKSEDARYIQQDCVQIDRPDLVSLYREVLIDYLKKHSMEKQLTQLKEVIAL